jgi:hypothetical protein
MFRTFFLLAAFTPFLAAATPNHSSDISSPNTRNTPSPLTDTTNTPAPLPDKTTNTTTTATTSNTRTPDTTTSTAAAPHAAPALLFSGSADMYYRYDLARTDKNAITSFTHSHNQFNLGMVSIKLEHRTSRVDMVADLGAGPRQQEYAYNDVGIVQLIKQLYISYSPNSWLKLTAGTWTTHLGYEVLDAFGNRNYSMSYLFTNTVFSHTGVKADLSFGKSSFMIGISNPGDYRTVPPGSFNNKQVIAQYGYAPNDNLKLYFNYYGGRDISDNRVHQYDLVVTNKFSPLFNIGFDGSVNVSSISEEKYANSRTWAGSALFLNFDPKAWLGFTLRTEYFDDKYGQHLSAPASIFSNTLSANFKIDGFTFIPEFRLDHATAPIFFNSDNNAVHTAANFLFAAVYSF